MPPSVGQNLSRAGRAAKAGDLEVAAALFRDVLDHYPGNRKARAGLQALGRGLAVALAAEARALEAAGSVDAAEAKWADAATEAPEDAGIGLELVRCRLDLGRAAEALEAANTVLGRHPGHHRAFDLKGLALRELGRDREAEASHRAALGHGVADAGPLNHLGILARARGDLMAAQEYFRKAVALSPGTPHLHHNLARAHTYCAGDRHIGQMRTQLMRFSPEDAGAAPLHFALFKALDELGEQDKAFFHLSEGNRLCKSAQPFDIRREATRFAFIKALCKEGLPELKADTEQRGLVFIIGLPRSGTTLVERILSQAPDARACGELQVATTACARLLRRARARNGPPALTPDDMDCLRKDLLDGYAPFRRDDRVIIDKMPQNFRWAGFLLTARPDARIVHISRDPVPLAWSLYRHLFAGRGIGFVHDFADIATYMLLHRDLMAFWHKQFAGRITEIAYGDLVADPATTARRLVAACGLTWSEDCLRPERAQGPVLTASADQVRRPIYTGSDEAWRRYERHLVPLCDTLRLAGITG